MQNNSRQSSLEGIEGGSSGPKGEELAQCLQRELVRARLHAAEREAAERDLLLRISELESENKSLRRQRVDNNVAHLQVWHTLFLLFFVWMTQAKTDFW